MKKVDIVEKRRVFDGFFKIDEASLRYERYDGTMSPLVRRLCFERGDSVAALIQEMRSGELTLVENTNMQMARFYDRSISRASSAASARG